MAWTISIIAERQNPPPPPFEL